MIRRIQNGTRRYLGGAPIVSIGSRLPNLLGRGSPISDFLVFGVVNAGFGRVDFWSFRRGRFVVVCDFGSAGSDF